MTFITTHSRFWPRVAVLSTLGLLAVVGFAGAANTIAVWNEDSTAKLDHEDRIEAEHRAAIQAIEAKTAEIEGEVKVAEKYSELGLRQPNCQGDTLQGFSFAAGMPVADQLNLFGFDWGAPRYNSDRWYPLFDSSGLLFAAIRVDPGTGQQVLAQADQQALHHASICNLNQLSETQP
ncbi:hypothetical protein H6F75_00640 [Nodosilinea sp. FACHB-131]|uniref:hypothetical protein n=1 Tax=Cyanophyceae TaxID=3028117 RepID=UPI001687E745|nr:hypothetical protein [Nodosilinea sp. FACHB-131]MBD1871978.1 hypothetical protein [Nodosilinea sp. FACHB-131]